MPLSSALAQRFSGFQLTQPQVRTLPVLLIEEYQVGSSSQTVGDVVGVSLGEIVGELDGESVGELVQVPQALRHMVYPSMPFPSCLLQRFSGFQLTQPQVRTLPVLLMEEYQSGLSIHPGNVGALVGI